MKNATTTYDNIMEMFQHVSELPTINREESGLRGREEFCREFSLFRTS